VPFKGITHNWQISFWQLLWWLVVIAIVVLLKHHYSVSSVAQLQWVFQPLAILLELLTGQGFYQDSNYEWVSLGADIRLVKSCAGINFMIMSFLLYSWVFRPEGEESTGFLTRLLGAVLLLSAAFGAAWITCLFANSIRIVIAMTAISQQWHVMMPGVDEHQLHRLIGMMVYMPVLSLQILFDRRSIYKKIMVYLAPISLYAMVLIVVPILTGNAFKQMNIFVDHVLSMAWAIGLVAIIVAVRKFSAHGKKVPMENSGTDKLTSEKG